MAVCRKRHSSDQSLLLSIAYETVRGRPEQEGKKKKRIRTTMGIGMKMRRRGRRGEGKEKKNFGRNT